MTHAPDKFRFVVFIRMSGCHPRAFKRTVTAKNRPNAEQVFAIKLYQKCREIGAKFVMPKFSDG